jgi:hypothetical protein
MRQVLLAITLATFVLALTPVMADEEPDARTIMDRSFKAQIFEMDQVEAELTLNNIDRRGNVTTQKMRVRSKRGADDLSKSIIFFNHPEDIKGTGFLVLERKDGDDDQFLYPPALQRVKRIRSDQRGKSFMGTQYSYADLQSRDLDEYAYRKLPEEKLGPFDCYVIESTPVDAEGKQYSRILSHVRKDNYVPLRVQMFDTRGRLHKVLSTEKVRVIDGKFVVTSSTIRNKRNNKATQMVVTDIDTKVEFEDTIFTQQSLEKGL